MCKWSKWGNTRIDPCMEHIIKFINFSTNLKTVMCCCGHNKYPMTIVVKNENNNFQFELISNTYLDSEKKRFYKKDKQGVYYIPEVRK